MKIFNTMTKKKEEFVIVLNIFIDRKSTRLNSSHRT